MLILTRKIEEAIYIGNNAEIRIQILGVQGNHVRLGIQAPRDIPVHREEIYLKLRSASNEALEIEIVESMEEGEDSSGGEQGQG